MDTRFRFKTRSEDALLLLVAGGTDYCIVELKRGALKVSSILLQHHHQSSWLFGIEAAHKADSQTLSISAERANRRRAVVNETASLRKFHIPMWKVVV